MIKNIIISIITDDKLFRFLCRNKTNLEAMELRLLKCVKTKGFSCSHYTDKTIWILLLR